MIDIKIIGSGKYVPKKTITNDDLSKMVDTSDEWIVSRTGIKNRYQVTFEKTSDLAYFAALDAINKANYDKDNIDLIIVASITGEQKTPSVANFVQGKLGIKNAMSFDINAACTGFIYGLEVAANLLKSNKFKGALIIGSEALTTVVDYTDRNTCVLFGDGAGAIIIEPITSKTQQSYYYNDASADMNDILSVNEYIKMEGPKVYLFAIEVIKKSINKVLELSNLTIDDIDIIIPHQANERIIQAVSKNMDIPISKFMINLKEYGNTSAASIPISISDLDNKDKKYKRAILVGFGGGFTWGAALLNL